MQSLKTIVAIAALLAAFAAVPGTARAGKLKVVVTSSAYAPIAEYIGGDKVRIRVEPAESTEED